MELVANNGVIQKTISLHAWKLMMISKRDCFTNDGKEYKRGINGIQAYLRDYLGNTSELSYKDLYYILLQHAIFEFCDEDKIKTILLYDIPNHIKHIGLFFNENNVYLSYKDFSFILIEKLSMIELRGKKDNEYIDKFVIEDEDHTLITLDEATKRWLVSSTEVTRFYQKKLSIINITGDKDEGI